MRVGLGQDSHRFDIENPDKPLMLGGIVIPDSIGLKGNSDADVVLHAITNAVSGITCRNILGQISDDLCLNKGITDSRVYLQKALQDLERITYAPSHLSLSIECKHPKITPHISNMRRQLGALLSLSSNNIGITATTGEGLTAFGRGEGIQVLAILTAQAFTE